MVTIRETEYATNHDPLQHRCIGSSSYVTVRLTCGHRQCRGSPHKTSQNKSTEKLGRAMRDLHVYSTSMDAFLTAERGAESPSSIAASNGTCDHTLS
jgi:hypothetical protein